ncbi:PREDICTED: sigma factor binding protein 1, chloroplastic [Ipomoea nil]|uniref:sigma factor binding protein 1, chloroplastic n=1 Tax=Ipomoea nil TaxID=35883 RepID=UPI0009014A30|nr:PREDICTED: sigma factor binding protein 1, chloroplastic [Ipomoea nil]
MEKTLSAQPPPQKKKKALKQPKAAANAAARKQLKVVYISNPMKVETSPSEFRALVQELTGQDADVPGPPFKFPGSPGVGAGGGMQLVVPDGNKVSAEEHSGEAGVQHGSSDVPESSDLSSETAPDYLPQLIEDFPGIMPSNMWYD